MGMDIHTPTSPKGTASAYASATRVPSEITVSTTDIAGRHTARK